jgi:hypothetical protein
MNNQTPSNEEIAELAHQLWDQEGRPEGKSEEFWLKAEAQLRQGVPETDLDVS